MPQKILEISGQDFLKALSQQAGLALGGLFQVASNYDPFDKMGVLRGSLVPVQKGASQIVTNIRTLTPYLTNKSYLIGFSDKVASGSCAYLINITDDVVTDISGHIFEGVTDETCDDCIIYKGYVIYSGTNSIRRNLPTAPTAIEDKVLVSLGWSQGNQPFHIGPDGNLYFGHLYAIGKITSVAGTGGNSENILAFANSDMVVKDLTDDGTYLIIAADNNSYKVDGKSLCLVSFWDTVKGIADINWPINDSYLIGCAFFDGAVYVFGSQGIYICNAATRPRMIARFGGNSILRAPTNQNQITSNGHSIFWAEGGVNGSKIFAYGSPLPGQPKRFYQPYYTHQSNYINTALCHAGGPLFGATTSNKLFALNTGTTYGSVTLKTAKAILPVPYTFDYAKINLIKPLTSGQSIIFGMSSDNKVISDNDTKTSSTDANKNELIFRKNPNASNVSQFNSFELTVTAEAGAEAEKIEIYGTPQDDHTQRS